jgi:MFS family permease
MNDSNSEKVSRYTIYALIILVLALILSYIDRHIVSVLAQEIKMHLHLMDAHLGFLYGTAFAVFYSIFALPLARLADVWSRKKTIGIGLLLWSLMTALSGLAQNFASLAIFRFGVGIGEASLNPAAFSLLADYFPMRFRATAIGIFLSGSFIGAGCALFIGALAIKFYHFLFPLGNAPFHLQAWQFAFLFVGLPGILMAFFVFSLREPKRANLNGTEPAPLPVSPWKIFFNELGAIIPPFSLLILAREGAGKRGIIINLLIGVICISGAIILIELSGHTIQWLALALSVYCFFSWLAGLKLSDPICYYMIFRNKTLLYGTFGLGFFLFSLWGVVFWMAPYAIRRFNPNLAEMGLILGLSLGIMGTLSSIIGGSLSDWLRRKTPGARLYVPIIAILLSTPLSILLFTTASLKYFYLYAFLYSLTAYLGTSSLGALPTEMVAPRIRATAGAFVLFTVGILGISLGPFLFGLMSDMFISRGINSADSIRNAVIMGSVPLLIAIIFLFISSRYIEEVVIKT